LKVKHACTGLQQAEIDLSTGAITMLAGATSTESEKSRVLCLMNMVTIEDLTDNAEYEGMDFTL
jgi:splicing factor U2AF subunit